MVRVKGRGAHLERSLCDCELRSRVDGHHPVAVDLSLLRREEHALHVTLRGRVALHGAVHLTRRACRLRRARNLRVLAAVLLRRRVRPGGKRRRQHKD
eukprot:5466544-Pleurochrysis_carterae.AAC.1